MSDLGFKITGGPIKMLVWANGASTQASREEAAMWDRISQQDAEPERVRRELEETRRLSSVALDEAMFMREKAIANARERNAAEAKLAEARKTAFIEAAEIAQNITSAECREIISEEKWVDMTDDYGEHIGQMKQGACFRLNFRKGIAAALRAKAEETRT